MTRKTFLIVFGIFILGFLLRVYRLSNLPMYGDELTMVYDSYSLLKTGKDQTGESFPLSFKMGAGRPAGYVYASIPFVYLFGPTELGIRTLSLLSGLGILVFIYLLAKKLFNQNTAIFALFLASISPWDISLSRAGFEAHFALLLSLSGIYFFLLDKKWTYVLWGLLWGIALHTYPTFKVVLPLIFPFLVWYKSKTKKLPVGKFFWAGVLVLAVFVGLSINETIKGRSEERFFAINVFSQGDFREQIIQKVNYERNISGLPSGVNLIFHNKTVEYGVVLVESYLKNFSTEFLIVKGDRNPRHNPGETGGIYLVEIITIFLGLAPLWQKEKRVFLFLSIWLFIGPLPTSFLLDPHFLRSSFMLPPLILLSSYGFSTIKSRKVKAVLLAFIFVQLAFILERMNFVAPERHANFWSTEAKKVSIMAIGNTNKKETIVLSTKIDNIEYAYPVYAKIDPNLVISQYGKFPKRYGNVIITDK